MLKNYSSPRCGWGKLGIVEAVLISAVVVCLDRCIKHENELPVVRGIAVK